MFNHTVIFWTNPAIEGAAEELLVAFECLHRIPGVIHVGYGTPYDGPLTQKPTVDRRQVSMLFYNI
jgi:hypothetical protein